MRFATRSLRSIQSAVLSICCARTGSGGNNNKLSQQSTDLALNHNRQLSSKLGASLSMGAKRNTVARLIMRTAVYLVPPPWPPPPAQLTMSLPSRARARLRVRPLTLLSLISESEISSTTRTAAVVSSKAGWSAAASGQTKAAKCQCQCGAGAAAAASSEFNIMRIVAQTWRPKPRAAGFIQQNGRHNHSLVAAVPLEKN